MRAYPEYKNSDVEWLGAIPSHWDVTYSKWLFRDRNEKALSDDEQLTASQKYGVISQKEYMRLENKKVTQVILNHEILKHVEPCDFVISMRSFQGGIEYCPYSGSVSSAYVPLYPLKIIDNNYFKYLFKSKTYIQALQSTTNLVRDGQALRYNNFIQVDLPNVPYIEQVKIGKFLDREVSRVDELISEKKNFISLLKEKNQALISHAVTKGLDPNTEMKESGVEWIGEVSADWEVKPLYTVGRESKTSNLGMIEINLLSLSYGNIKQKSIETLEGLLPESFETHQIVEKDYIVFRMTDLQNDKRSLRTAICNERGIITSAYIAFEPRSINPQFLNYLVRGYDVNKVFYNLGSGLRQSLKYDELKRIPITIPPSNEQEEIVGFLESETSKIDQLIEAVEISIELLNEHRTAIINSTVTGKIDVRDMA